MIGFEDKDFALAWKLLQQHVHKIIHVFIPKLAFNVYLLIGGNWSFLVVSDVANVFKSVGKWKTHGWYIPLTYSSTKILYTDQKKKEKCKTQIVFVFFAAIDRLISMWDVEVKVTV